MSEGISGRRWKVRRARANQGRGIQYILSLIWDGDNTHFLYLGQGQDMIENVTSLRGIHAGGATSYLGQQTFPLFRTKTRYNWKCLDTYSSNCQLHPYQNHSCYQRPFPWMEYRSRFPHWSFDLANSFYENCNILKSISARRSSEVSKLTERNPLWYLQAWKGWKSTLSSSFCTFSERELFLRGFLCPVLKIK